MPLLFTRDEFFDVFRRYDEAVWPAQWLLAALALVAVVFAVRAALVMTRKMLLDIARRAEALARRRRATTSPSPDR